LDLGGHAEAHLEATRFYVGQPTLEVCHEVRKEVRDHPVADPFIPSSEREDPPIQTIELNAREPLLERCGRALSCIVDRFIPNPLCARAHGGPWEGIRERIANHGELTTKVPTFSTACG